MLLKSSVNGAKVVHKEWERMRLEDDIIYRKGLTEEPKRFSSTISPRKVQIGCVNSPS